MDFSTASRNASLPVILDKTVVLSGVQAIAFAAATANNVPLPALYATTVYRLTPFGGGTSISGMTAPTQAQLLLLVNVSTTDNLTLLHNSGLSAAGSRFLLPSGASYVLAPGVMAWAWYDLTSTAWRVK